LGSATGNALDVDIGIHYSNCQFEIDEIVSAAC
jgi:hypothetical protein